MDWFAVISGAVSGYILIKIGGCLERRKNRSKFTWKCSKCVSPMEFIVEADDEDLVFAVAMNHLDIHENEV